jgi:hypothetical protein
MHMGLVWTERWVGIEMGNAMLALHCVVGLAAIDPVAIHTDAHAS